MLQGFSISFHVAKRHRNSKHSPFWIQFRSKTQIAFFVRKPFGNQKPICSKWYPTDELNQAFLISISSRNVTNTKDIAFRGALLDQLKSVITAAFIRSSFESKSCANDFRNSIWKNSEGVVLWLDAPRFQGEEIVQPHMRRFSRRNIKGGKFPYQRSTPLGLHICQANSTENRV